MFQALERSQKRREDWDEANGKDGANLGPAVSATLFLKHLQLQSIYYILNSLYYTVYFELVPDASKLGC